MGGLRLYDDAYYRASSSTPSLTTLLLFTCSESRGSNAFRSMVTFVLSIAVPLGIGLSDEGYTRWRWTVAVFTWLYLNGFIRWGFDAWLHEHFQRAVNEGRIVWVANVAPQVREGMSPEQVVHEVARSAALRHWVKKPDRLPSWEVAALPVSPWQPGLVNNR